MYEGGSSAAFQLYCLSLVVVGLFQSASWAYAAFRPGLMKAAVTRRYRVGRVLIALFVPGFFLVMSQLSGRGFGAPLVYGAVGMSVAVAVLRRIVMPWINRRGERRRGGERPADGPRA